MENSVNKINIGCSWPIAVIVFLAFFYAKINDKIDWSWLWVFSPLWIPVVLVIIVFLVIIVLKIWANG